MGMGATSGANNRSSYIGKGSSGLFAKKDPLPPKKENDVVTKKPMKASDDAILRMREQMGKANLKTVEAYNPVDVKANTIKGVASNVAQGMGDLQDASGNAARNVGIAGQMDPRTAAFLQAAQMNGQYSPQAINMMQQAAMGQGPSAAQGQLQSGVDQAIKAQMAAAGSRGFNAAAMRGAQMQGAEMQQAAVNQSAQLRAQEQQAAQQQYLQASLQQEDMQRQAALQAAGINLNQDVASQQARQAAINSQGQIAGQYAGLGMEQTLADAQMQQQARLANQDAMLRAAMFNSGQGLDAWKAQQQGNLGYAGIGADMTQNYFSTLMGGEFQRRQTNAAIDQANSDRKWQMAGALIGAGGAVGAGFAGRTPASDKRAKTNIKPNNETQAFLEALTDNSYNYKEPNRPGRAPGRHYGPMAQDLEKTAMGKTVVIEQDGTKMVDSSRGFLLALSGLANIHQRLKALEA